MAATRTVTFKLNGKRPEDLPIDRIGQYLKVLADLVGAAGSVRATALRAGSVAVDLTVAPHHYPALVERLSTARNPDASTAVAKVVRTIEQMISEDGVTAEVRAGRTKIFYLEGYAKSAGDPVGPVAQHYVVRGTLIGLEGKDATKHARIAEYGTDRELHGFFRDDDVAVAEKLTEYLWKGVIEVSGTAKWLRYPDGRWELKSFRIEDARALEGGRPSEFIRGLRTALGDSGADVLAGAKQVRG